MRDLIASLEEATGPKRLTRMPHTCPHGWTQVKVKKGGRTFYTCQEPSAMKLAQQGANPLDLAWKAVKKYDLPRAERSLNIGKYTTAQNRIRYEILELLDQEQDPSMKQGKRWLLKTLKPMFKKLGVNV
jgi:ribosomal protein L24E